MTTQTKPGAEQSRVFLLTLMTCGNVTTAGQASGIARKDWYRRRAEDEKFALAWNEALRIGVEALEDEARRRAFDGVKDAVFYQGKEVAQVTKYSDTLLMFLLKAHKPETYRDTKRTEPAGPDTGPVIPEDITELDNDERARRITSILELAARKGG